MAQRQMSFLPLPSWVETTLLSEWHSRTTMDLDAEQLAGEILLKGGWKEVCSCPAGASPRERQKWMVTYLFDPFPVSTTLSLLLLKVI